MLGNFSNLKRSFCFQITTSSEVSLLKSKSAPAPDLQISKSTGHDDVIYMGHEVKKPQSAPRGRPRKIQATNASATAKPAASAAKPAVTTVIPALSTVGPTVATAVPAAVHRPQAVTSQAPGVPRFPTCIQSPQRPLLPDAPPLLPMQSSLDPLVVRRIFINMMLQASKSHPDPKVALQQWQNRELDLNDFLVQLAKSGHLDPTVRNVMLNSGMLDPRVRSVLASTPVTVPFLPPMLTRNVQARPVCPAFQQAAAPRPQRSIPSASCSSMPQTSTMTSSIVTSSQTSTAALPAMTNLKKLNKISPMLMTHLRAAEKNALRQRLAMMGSPAPKMSAQVATPLSHRLPLAPPTQQVAFTAIRKGLEEEDSATDSTSNHPVWAHKKEGGSSKNKLGVLKQTGKFKAKKRLLPKVPREISQQYLNDVAADKREAREKIVKSMQTNPAIVDVLCNNRAAPLVTSQSTPTSSQPIAVTVASVPVTDSTMPLVFPPPTVARNPPLLPPFPNKMMQQNLMQMLNSFMNSMNASSRHMVPPPIDLNVNNNGSSLGVTIHNSQVLSPLQSVSAQKPAEISTADRLTPNSDDAQGIDSAVVCEREARSGEDALSTQQLCSGESSDTGSKLNSDIRNFKKKILQRHNEDTHGGSLPLRLRDTPARRLSRLSADSVNSASDMRLPPEHSMSRLSDVPSERLRRLLEARNSLFECVCGATFTSLALYQLHKSCHNSEQPSKCATCRRCCTSWMDFFAHLYDHGK